MSQPASPSSNKKNLLCKVFMLDDTEETFHVPHKSKGSVLFEMVVKKLQLLESDYFDLQYVNIEGMLCWLDHEKSITSHLPANSLTFEFVVKFYTPDPGMLEEEYTRYLFALQVKRDLLTGKMPCHDQTAALLLSYIVQADYGDLTEEDLELNPEYLRYISHFSHISEELENNIVLHHKEHFGQTPTEADFNLLDTARKVDFYGISLQSAKDHEGVPLHLAATHMGVVVFQCNTRINTFSWAKIRKLSFKRKKFLVKLHPEGYVEVGFYRDTVEFYFNSRNECKNFWKRCLEHHAFFRCHSVKKIPRNKTRVVSHGSSFRYSGRTQKQLVDFVRENFVKRPNFHRSTSMRTVSGISRTGTLKSKGGTVDTPGHVSRSRKSEILSPSQPPDKCRQSSTLGKIKKDRMEGEGKNGGFVDGVLRSGKSEIILKNRSYSMKVGTVDDFDCSYFKTFHATRHSCSNAGLKKTDTFKDNASQDSYRLQGSRDSLNDDVKGGDNGENVRGNIHVVNADFHSGEDFVEVVEGVLREGSEELKRQASLKSTHDSRKQLFANRSATVAHDQCTERLNNQFTGQSYSTDIDSVLSPIDNKSDNKKFDGGDGTMAHLEEFGGVKEQLMSPSQAEEEECITIIDSKEDGIQYYLHKKSTKQAERNTPSFYGKMQNDQTKNILEEVKMKISKPERKFYEYISTNKLPHRDTFSCRDDTLDNDVFFKNDDASVWRKVENNIDVKSSIRHTKDFTTRGRILSESDSEHLGHNKNKEVYNMRVSVPEYRKEMRGDVEDVLNLSECGDKSGFSNFEERPAPEQEPSVDNVNHILYKRRASVLPYNELVKLDLAFIADKENYGRHYFCTIDQDLFHKGESSSDNDRFSWMAIPRYRQSFKSSISYRTGYATGSSSSLSIAEEFEGGYRAEVKGGRPFQPHHGIRMSSGDTNTTHIDKRGHVIEWLEEQQALLEPSCRTTYVKNDLRLCNRLAALKHAGSLPMKVRQASMPSSHSSKHPNMQNQSSFSTQSFPEPVMEISSDECPMTSKANTEGFYDVNRILDYVADSNRYINPQLLGYTTSSDYNNENHACAKAPTSKDATNTQRNKVSKVSSFDAGRYRIFNSKNCLHTLSINPEKMFNSELKRLRSSQSSQNEEDHVSDILDAIGMTQQTEVFEQQCSMHESFNRVITETQTLNEKLNDINFPIDKHKKNDIKMNGFPMDKNNDIKMNGCYDDGDLKEPVKPYMGGDYKREEAKPITVYPTPRKLERKTTENVCMMKILAPVRPISLKTNFIGVVETKVENKIIKKPIIICDTVNLQLKNREDNFVVNDENILQVIKVEVAEKVVKKARLKPRKIPDKFELFLAGVKVNLPNIVDRDPKCENQKEALVRGKHPVDLGLPSYTPSSQHGSMVARNHSHHRTYRH